MTGTLRTVGVGLAFFPFLTSFQGPLLLSALPHGVMWYFFREEGSLSALVMVGSPEYVQTRWQSHLSFSVMGWKGALLASEW